MKILLVHNRYQIPGGEDTVFAAEKAMLEGRGHEVAAIEADNTGITNPVAAGLSAIWSSAGKQLVAAELARFRPDVMHVHNFFPLLSPSIYSAAREAGVPVVQTLHNYRLICPNALFYRDGHVCEDCLGTAVPVAGILHACYRQSRLATAPVAAMIAIHRALQTWTKSVDVYIALTEFAREKFVAGGLPAEKIVVKPNFVDPLPARGDGRGGYALFVGRLSEEKGVRTLLSAWEAKPARLPLKIVGDGPLAGEVKAATERNDRIEWLGRVSRDRVVSLMQDAVTLVFPSEWYEPFGLSVIEAFATGLPVIASNLGNAVSLVESGRTGLHYRSGDAIDLAKRVEWVAAHPSEWDQMRSNARRECELRYTAQKNYEQLIAIYERCSGQSQSRQH